MGTISERPHEFGDVGGLQFGVVAPAVVASAVAMSAPTHKITHVSGTAEMTTIALPWPGFTGSIIYIPDGAFTGATGGAATDTAKPIGKAFTAVVQRALEMVFDGTLWYPSY